MWLSRRGLCNGSRRATKTTPGTHDVVLAAFAVAGDPIVELERIDGLEHSRVARAIRHRDDVRIYVTPDRAAVLVLGRGLTRRGGARVRDR